jgi:hypothetical protein
MQTIVRTAPSFSFSATLRHRSVPSLPPPSADLMLTHISLSLCADRWLDTEDPVPPTRAPPTVPLIPKPRHSSDPILNARGGDQSSVSSEQLRVRQHINTGGHPAGGRGSAAPAAHLRRRSTNRIQSAKLVPKQRPNERRVERREPVIGSSLPERQQLSPIRRNLQLDAI